MVSGYKELPEFPKWSRVPRSRVASPTHLWKRLHKK
jgi:hypothetical protein